MIKNILLIDDDDDDQEIFLTALKALSSPIHCTTFHNAREALQQLIEKTIRPDMIFLDLNMPGMNGQEFLLAIKKIDDLKNIPIIIFSTSAHGGTIELTKELGAHDFITKPDKFDDLVSILQRLLS